MVIVARVLFRGPLEPYAQGFADELLRQGYSPKTSMKSQLFFVALEPVAGQPGAGALGAGLSGGR